MSKKTLLEQEREAYSATVRRARRKSGIVDYPFRPSAEALEEQRRLAIEKEVMSLASSGRGKASELVEHLLQGGHRESEVRTTLMRMLMERRVVVGRDYILEPDLEKRTE